ncbi:RNase adapter RapZ [Parendozoicomonas haliclonae]|uniref:GlmZ(SRNA)-inactivating NTPase n=1 Tax=Parendozoicomonas haliclonae TaxID=1960125 RepID=A0A1X7AHT8_9GAMM|nr:RNase adapter RapZ [Parendozoicomonas haliclonae]SMA37305.1 glmZ(sRNA)-inactivating NTPase [Parendozoicomonas haliclonae]
MSKSNKSNIIRLVIISGRSGSGKSSALAALEDQGFYCIDNLPATLLTDLISRFTDNDGRALAVSIDARNTSGELASFSEIHRQLKNDERLICDVIFLDADHETLLKRFSATRRRHPLSDGQSSLDEAIHKEAEVLGTISDSADMRVDTSRLSLHELRSLIRQRVAGKEKHELALQFESFGFKKGVPIDADFVFDVRCLPNPYWNEELRVFTGRDQPVIDFLSAHDSVKRMQEDISEFISRWLPVFEEGNRSYLTVAIGCTGGQHRSVFVSEAVARSFANHASSVQVRHRELGESFTVAQQTETQ